MVNDWIAVAALAVVAALVPLTFVVASRLLRPSVPEKEKSRTYESGENPTGDTRIRFSIQYYMIALLFVIFDIETVLLYPWTVVFVDDQTTFLPAMLFIVILFVGVGWAWKNGAMEWIRPQREGR